MNKILLNICYATLLTIFLILLAIISIKPFGNDELFFMHFAWAFNNEHLNNLNSIYPLPFSTILFSAIYKIGSLNSFLFWKPILAICYLSIFCKDIKNKKSLASLVLLILIILNRGIEVRPESICAILLLLITSFEFDFDKKSIYIKFICLLFIAFISLRFSIISILVYTQIVLFSKNRIKVQHFIIPIIIFIAFYGSLIELPWRTVNDVLKWTEQRNTSDAAYKLHRIFSPNFSYIFIVSMLCINLIEKIYNKSASKNDLFFLCAFILNIIYLFSFDNVPFEYTFLPTAIYVRWYINQNHTITYQHIYEKLFAKFYLLILLIFFLYDLHMSRNLIQNVVDIYYKSRNIQINEKGLLNRKIFSYQQLLIRNFICQKYQGYKFYTNSYKFHAVCVDDNLSLSKSRKLLSEEDVIRQIYLRHEVNFFYENENFFYLYK